MTTGEIARIVESTNTVETASSSPQFRRRKGLSVTLMTQRSGVRSITPQDMIWKTANFFGITIRCHHQQYRWPRTPNGVNIVGPIPLMTMSRWGRST
jgi:hypothetical protein